MPTDFEARARRVSKPDKFEARARLSREARRIEPDKFEVRARPAETVSTPDKDGDDRSTFDKIQDYNPSRIAAKAIVGYFQDVEKPDDAKVGPGQASRVALEQALLPSESLLERAEGEQPMLSGLGLLPGDPTGEGARARAALAPPDATIEERRAYTFPGRKREVIDEERADLVRRASAQNPKLYRGLQLATLLSPTSLFKRSRAALGLGGEIVEEAAQNVGKIDNAADVLSQSDEIIPRGVAEATPPGEVLRADAAPRGATTGKWKTVHTKADGTQAVFENKEWVTVDPAKMKTRTGQDGRTQVFIGDEAVQPAAPTTEFGVAADIKPIDPTTADKGSIVQVLPKGLRDNLEEVRDREKASAFVYDEWADLDVSGRDVRINLDRIENVNDARVALTQLEDLYKTQIDENVGGVRSLAQTEKLSQETGISLKQLVERKPGEVLNDIQINAARSMSKAIAEETKYLGKLIKANKATGEQEVEFYNLFQLAKMTEIATTAAKAELARAVGSLRIVAKSTPNVRELIQKEFPLLLKNPAFKELQKANPDATNIQLLADMLDEIDDPGQMLKLMREMQKPTASEIFYELFINGLVSGIKTNVVNFGGGIGFNTLSLAERYAGALVGSLRFNKANRAQAIKFADANEALFGTAQGYRDGARLAMRVMQRDPALFNPKNVADGLLPDTFDVRVGALQKKAFDMKMEKPNALSTKVVSKVEPVVTIFGRLLQAGDAFNKTVAYRQKVNELTMRMARQEGLTGVAQRNRINDLRNALPEAIAREAKAFATKMAFQTPLGERFGAASNLVNRTPGGRLIFPFIRTPVNIMKEGVDRSPLGLARKEVRDDLSGLNGVAAQDLARVKMAIGTGLSLEVMALLADDRITGAPPRNKAARDRWYLDGKKPYSVKINGEWYSYARLEPLATVIGLAADSGQIIGQIEEKGASGLAGGVIHTISQNITNKIFMQNLRLLIDATTNEDDAAKMIQKIGASIVTPTLVSEMERLQDPVVRDVQSMIDQVISRTPGWSETLPAQYDLLGEVIVSPPGWGPDIMSPIPVSPETTDVTRLEVSRLDPEISKPERKIWNIELSGSEYEEFSRLSGLQAKSRLDTFITSTNYKKLNDETRRTEIKNLFNDSKQDAATKYIGMLKARDPAGFKARYQASENEAIQKEFGVNLGK